MILLFNFEKSGESFKNIRGDKPGIAGLFWNNKGVGEI